MKAIMAWLLLCAAAWGSAFAQEAAPAPGEEREVNGFTFVWCPPGSFEMGNRKSLEELTERFGGLPEWYSSSRPACTATIPRGFWLGKYEVTLAQWNEFAAGAYRRALSQDSDGQLPVANVTRPQIQTLLDSLNESGAGRFRLPSEVEWEYACRAGSPGIFFSGDDPESMISHAWFANSARPGGLDAPQPVGQKTPNNWGLHDMLGNVWEWCGTPYVTVLPCGKGAGPPGTTVQGSLAVRGGSIQSTAGHIRCATRLGYPEEGKSPLLGFRLVWEPAP